MSDVIYLGSIFLVLGAYGVGAWAIWQVIEGAYWIYCKATGRDY